MPPNARRIGCIDGLRGYLAISVMFHHFIVWLQIAKMGRTWSLPTIAAFNELGASGVALFFMTTGLVFYPRILAGFRRSSWSAIYISRVFRIIPLVVFSFLIISAVAAYRSKTSLHDINVGVIADWISGWSEPSLFGYRDSGQVNAYVLWSLWFEWVFYIAVLPICALAMDAIRGRLPTWSVPASLIVISVSFQHVFGPRFAFPHYAPLFGLGMLAFEVQRQAFLSRFLRTSAATFIGTVSLVVALVTFSVPHTVGLPFLWTFFVCVACGNTFGGVLATRGALVLGECSFGIYLLHGIILNLFFVEGASLLAGVPILAMPLLLPLLLLMVLLVTQMTYRGIERPAIRAGAALGRVLGARAIDRRALEADVVP